MEEKLKSFLNKKKAHEHPHYNGTLEDHLIRTYMILKNKGFSENICLGGGLHSI
jgi:hypothetical protein